eukprot:m.420436 g.420436  ORF g.420436 m.420436 type:complete len:206 (+) comp16846_c2_seq10:479-1096(+)
MNDLTIATTSTQTDINVNSTTNNSIFEDKTRTTTDNSDTSFPVTATSNTSTDPNTITDSDFDLIDEGYNEEEIFEWTTRDSGDDDDDGDDEGVTTIEDPKASVLESLTPIGTGAQRQSALWTTAIRNKTANDSNSPANPEQITQEFDFVHTHTYAIPTLDSVCEHDPNIDDIDEWHLIDLMMFWNCSKRTTLCLYRSTTKHCFFF